MEQVELARLLLELGAANAINLDGAAPLPWWPGPWVFPGWP